MACSKKVMGLRLCEAQCNNLWGLANGGCSHYIGLDILIPNGLISSLLTFGAPSLAFDTIFSSSTSVFVLQHKYKLHAVIVHAGSQDARHYLSYVRRGDIWMAYRGSEVCLTGSI